MDQRCEGRSGTRPACYELQNGGVAGHVQGEALEGALVCQVVEGPWISDHINDKSGNTLYNMA